MSQNHPRGRFLVHAFIAIIFLICPLLHAQTAVDGAIGGTVLDSSGAVVSGAAVAVHNNGTNAEQNAVTDASGYFRVIHLQPGAYNVTVTARDLTHSNQST